MSFVVFFLFEFYENSSCFFVDLCDNGEVFVDFGQDEESYGVELVDVSFVEDIELVLRK